MALKFIRQKRLEKNYSQDDMSERLSISQSQYARIEHGFTPVKFITLIEIIDLLEINRNDFLDALRE